MEEGTSFDSTHHTVKTQKPNRENISKNVSNKEHANA